MAVFQSLISENKEVESSRVDTRDYSLFNLNDLEDKDVFEGVPYMTEVFENEFTNDETGKTTKNFTANLYIADTETKEKLRLRVKTKSLEDKQQTRKGSVLYDLIDSIESLNDPNFAETNNTHTISIAEFREYINGLKYIKGTVISRENQKKNIYWNTFRITQTQG